MMLRSTAAATILGALLAAAAAYSGIGLGWRGAAATGPGIAEGAAVARLAIDTAPICLAIEPIDSAGWAELDPDFAAGKNALAAQDWHGAIAALTLAALRDPRNADIQNYIGHAYRRLRQFGRAMGHYQQALMLNPRHRGAHEHLGELYLALQEPAKAEEHLDALARICLLPCDELGGLRRVMAAYGSSGGRE
jgi:tetratricopeptide (TPR) repeat protein